jgi:YaiO family outer membrane protein
MGEYGKKRVSGHGHKWEKAMKNQNRMTVIILIILTFTSILMAQDPDPDARALKGLIYDELLMNVRIAVEDNNLENAEVLLNYLLDSYPGDADARLMRGRVLAWQKKYIEAEKDLLQVTTNTPHYTDAWDALTDLYIWVNRWEDAEKSCEVCLKQDPENGAYYIKYARILISLRKYSQARTALLKARELDTDKNQVSLLLEQIQRIQSPASWEAGVALDFQTFNTVNKSDWWGTVEFVKKELTDWTVLFEAAQYWRYDTRDGQFALEAYADAWQNAYYNVRTAVALNRQFLPYYDVYGEFYQGFAGKWEGAVSYRLMLFDKRDIHIPALAIGLYEGSFYLRYKFSYIFDENRKAMFNYWAARYFYKTVDDYCEAAYGYGRDIQQTLDLKTSDSHVFILRGQSNLKNQWLLQWMVNFHLNPNDEKQAGGRIGVSYRW